MSNKKVPICDWFNTNEKEDDVITPIKSDSDIISIEDFESLIPSKIFNKMINNQEILSKKNNVDFKTIKINDNISDKDNKKEIYYRGEFNEQGQKDGIGKMIIINNKNEKIFYYGLWEEDSLNTGVIYYINGEEYNGEMKNYLREGKGKFISENEIYEGNWIKDKKEGFGILKYKNGIKYEGNFKDNNFNGKGKIYFPNDIYYSGEFVNGLFHGQGFLKGNNNHIYNGNFKNGYYHGFGEFKWIDDMSMEIYKGNYVNGKKDGNGELKLKNDDIFKGNWESGNPHGEGIYETKNRKYYGNWRAGLFIHLTSVEEKKDAEEENFSLSFIIPEEDIKYQDDVFNSLYSNSSVNSKFVKGSIEKI